MGHNWRVRPAASRRRVNILTNERAATLSSERNRVVFCLGTRNVHQCNNKPELGKHESTSVSYKDWKTSGNSVGKEVEIDKLILSAAAYDKPTKKKKNLLRLLRAERMVRLCIASVDPAKLSSQCVMCNRREFPLTVIDCTGITKVNDLIANPLSVQEAKCLIYNCRRQVPQIKPEPYHGSVNNAANYRGASTVRSPMSSRYNQALTGSSTQAVSPLVQAGPMGLLNQLTGSGSKAYELMSSAGVFESGNNAYGQLQAMSPYQDPLISRYGYQTSMLGGLGGSSNAYPFAASSNPLSAAALRLPRGLIGGPSMISGQQPLPYALVPAPNMGLLPFGQRKYKAALVPLYK